jgi:NAD(P)H-hydrate epimerase
MLAAGVEVLRGLDETGTRVVAVDLPTGVDADTGAIARRAVRADLTVTFAAPKRGHVLHPGRAFVGALEVVDIGLDPAALAAADLPVTLATAAEMAALLPVRDPRAHKVSAGRVLVMGGSPGLTGAVALAARGAMRAGAGYVQVAVPASVQDVLATKLTEAMTLAMRANASGAFSMEAEEEILSQVAHADAVALGSGLSRDRDAAALARFVALACERPLVLDADGLNAFAEQRELLERRAAGPRVLTPHLGEMERLTGVPAADIEARRIDIAREWASRWTCVLVLKGAPTVVATPDGRASVNPTGNPALATAGTGDVLTGMIAALLAQRLTAVDAARLAVYVHGLAADRMVAERGPWGLVAGDLCEALPAAFQALAGGRSNPGRA